MSADVPNNTRHTIQIHLPGLIKILGETLYSEPEVAVREMIQNAHDSCLRRMAEAPGFRDPRIEINANTYERTLTFRDNGSGLTEQEVHDFLSTVGRGYTAELRQALSEKNREIAEKLIGQFGLGLLSAFIVADNIQIRTRSFKPDSPGLRWECDGNVEYTLTEAEKEDVGTDVVITVSDKYVDSVLQEETLARVIKTYADFLSIPICLNQSALPANVMNAPWHRQAASAEYIQYVRDRYEDIPPLEVIPLEHQDDQVSVQGVLYIPRHTMVSIKEYGDVDIYISRMFICQGDRDLLPVWAKFVRGVVDSSSLTPTLSRESVRKDEKYRRVQEVVSSAILDHLDRLAAEDPRQFREVVTSHNTLIKAWALEDDEFFDKICNLVLFETEYGQMNIPEYVRRFSGKEPTPLTEAQDADGEASQAAAHATVYYFSDVGSGTQQKILFSEAGLCVIDASYGAEQAFLAKYDERHPNVDVKKLDAAAGYIFEKVDDEDGRWARLEEEYMQRKLPASVVTFKPTDIPAVLLRVEPDKDHEEMVRKLADDEDVNPELRRFFRQLLKERDSYRKGSSTSETVLHLNAANPIIQQFAASEKGDPVRDLAMTVVYNNAVLFESHAVTPENAQLMVRGSTMAIEQLMEAHHNARSLESELTRLKVEHDEAIQKRNRYARQQEEKAEAANAEAEAARSRLDQLQQENAKSGQRSLVLQEELRAAEASRDELQRKLATLSEGPGGVASVIRSLNSRPNDVFVMRPFRDDIEWIYTSCIKPACNALGLNPIHLQDAIYAGRISEEIMKHIRECGILIADVTGANPNVMYEVGAAHILGKGKQTILVAKSIKDLPFDISDFRAFPYDTEGRIAGLGHSIEEALRAILDMQQQRSS